MSTIADTPITFKDRVEAVLAFGAIAYVGGFVTTFFHTARLGAPVIELLKPINVVVGLPLAAFLVSSNWLWNLVRARHKDFRTELDELAGQIREFKELPDHEALRQYFLGLAESVPGPSFVKKVSRSLMVKRIDEFFGKSLDLDRISKKLRAGMATQLHFAQGYSIFNRYITFLCGVVLGRVCKMVEPVVNAEVRGGPCSVQIVG